VGSLGGNMEIKASVNFLEDDLFKIENQSLSPNLYIDKPKDDYMPKGPNSLEMFLSALGGCVGVFAKRYLTRHKIEFKKLNVEVRAELSKESPLRLSQIKVKIDTDADLGDKKEIFEKFVQGCPVHNTLLHTKDVDISLI